MVCSCTWSWSAEMACGLSVVELYGARLLNPRVFFETMKNTDPTLSFLKAGSGRLTHGMYSGPKISDKDKDSSPQHTGLGVPLHRSPVVLEALSGLENEKYDNLSEIYEAGPSNKTDCPRPQKTEEVGESIEEGEALPEHYRSFSERRKITSRTSKLRGSVRVHPYGERSRAPMHIVMKDKNTGGMHASPSWPSGLACPNVVADNENICKSFSSPGNLDKLESPQAALRLSGDQMHKLAIQTFSNAFASPTTKVTFSPNVSHPTPTTTIALRNPEPKTSSSRSQQKDNFRRLLVPQNSDFSGILSAQDVSLQRKIRDSLAANGLCVIDGLLGFELATKIKKEVLLIHQSKGGVVRGDILGTRGRETSTRGDVISWVDGTEPHCQSIRSLCEKMDGIVSLGNGVAPAYNICGGTKAMVARYPGGGSQYKLHVDNPNKDGRCLTCLYYLNENWDVNTMGGQLRIHAETRGKTAEIAPIFDRLAVFYSDRRNPHEVLKCYSDRYAVTLWYFDLEERANALGRMDLMSHPSSRAERT